VDKIVEFATFCGEIKEFVVVGQIREFCRSCEEGRKKFTALVIITIYLLRRP